MPKSYQDLVNESLKEVALQKKYYQNLVNSALNSPSLSPINQPRYRSTQTPQKERVSPSNSPASTIRPLPFCSEPGRLPYRHDPLKTYLQYEQAWRNRPSPGEKTHDKLRWQVRKSLM